ncbi:MAG TPA: helix-turn-helix domain-containing protein, partial [Candidatus Aphodocola excrementigallinarum]|nr:helix-turn-helix domain-containing protein [Candidatus Aphodocola excrementigallinarum]
MYKSYKFRMYLSHEQSTQINKTFGCTRFIYNYF